MPIGVKVSDVSLQVPVFVQGDRKGHGWLSTLLNAALDPPKRRFRMLLSGISFEANEGDRIAVLGRNGAGKSTLLRVVNGVFLPTQGQVERQGSCQALLNIALGFNNDATLKENIFLRGTAIGMPTSVLGGLQEQILEFAGLQQKANHRFKTLSAGQRMRLGFAISTAVQHDIMLLDEWIGTGDAEFIAKAKERMVDRVDGSKVVILASHNLGLLKDVCNKALVLEGGCLVYFGDMATATREYHKIMLSPPPVEDVYRTPVPNQVVDDAPAEITFGCVETLELRDEELIISGWAVSSGSEMPTLLAIDALGQRRATDTFERRNRPDVMRHYDLPHATLGFRMTTAVPGLHSLSQLGGSFGVFGGNSRDQLAGPFHMGDATLRLVGAGTCNASPAD